MPRHEMSGSGKLRAEGKGPAAETVESIPGRTGPGDERRAEGQIRVAHHQRYRAVLRTRTDEHDAAQVRELHVAPMKKLDGTLIAVRDDQLARHIQFAREILDQWRVAGFHLRMRALRQHQYPE